ncbi:STM4015 family protein [Catenulispora yoronensis]|uniref:STM4015 family protein n=1 Tax=Catenulispora yoronensis TaxID=450799 RepID=A0ABN2V7K5_9ACTN
MINSECVELEFFGGLPVFTLPGRGFGTMADWPGRVEVPDDVDGWAWRIDCAWWEGPGFLELFEAFIGTVDTEPMTALILGNWVTDQDMDKTAAEMFAPLIAVADRFPNLTALFLGDIAQEHHEISWIHQSDLAPLLRAFPKLTQFGVRGSENLRWEARSYPELRELTFQSGGLPPEVVRAVGACDFPALAELELYLGDSEYFGGSDVEDLAGILDGAGLPNLRYLGLRDDENADLTAAAVAHAPIVARLEILDLSLGTLGDEGAAALLAGQPLTHLKKLDLHHHFISEQMQERLRDALPGVELDLSDPQEEDMDGDEVWRYVAVSE